MLKAIWIRAAYPFAAYAQYRDEKHLEINRILLGEYKAERDTGLATCSSCGQNKPGMSPLVAETMVEIAETAQERILKRMEARAAKYKLSPVARPA